MEIIEYYKLGSTEEKKGCGGQALREGAMTREDRNGWTCSAAAPSALHLHCERNRFQGFRPGHSSRASSKVFPAESDAAKMYECNIGHRRSPALRHTSSSHISIVFCCFRFECFRECFPFVDNQHLRLAASARDQW